MNRIVVTGATSMIGIALIEECVAHGAEVLAVVKPRSGRLGRLPKSDRLQVVEAELGKYSELNLSGKADVLYHFAWTNTGKLVRDNPILQAKNIEYTLDAVELAHHLGCKKFIGAGSQAEYGPVDGVITASTVPRPIMAYGMAKLSAGYLSRRLCEQNDIVWLWGRIFSVYGRYDNKGTMLDYAIRSFMDGKRASFSSGLQKWDYLYEKDAGKIFYLLGERAETSSVYRVASGRSRPLREFVELTARAMNAESLCQFETATGARLMGLEADVADLENVVGEYPGTPFEEGIRQVIAYYNSNRG